MNYIQKQATLFKLATIVRAVNHVKRVRMTKRAYGVGDNFEYIDRIPNQFFDKSTTKALVKGLQYRLKELQKQQAARLYDHDIYNGYKPDIYVSKYRYHYDPDKQAVNEMGLADYTKLVNDAIKSKNDKALQDVADYWSVRATIASPDARKKIQEALTKAGY